MSNLARQNAAIDLLVAVRDSAVTDSGHCSICLLDPHSPGCIIELVEKFIDSLEGDKCVHGKSFDEACDECTECVETPSSRESK